MFSRSLLIIFAWLFALAANAVTIPKRLDATDRREVVRLLGITTATKILSNPFPLGGYSGLEVGLSVELIDLGDLAKLGCAAGSPGCPNSGEGDRELRFSRVSVGKGLYENIDLFLHFAPMSAGTELTSFGGAVRYSFYEARFLPVNLSLIASADHLNVNDDFENLNFSADLVAGIYVDNVSLYVGVGQTSGTASFIGGDTSDGTVDPADPDLEANTNKVKVQVSQTHSLLGMTLHFDDVFAAFQLDRYPEAAYSARIGLRF